MKDCKVRGWAWLSKWTLKTPRMGRKREGEGLGRGVLTAIERLAWGPSAPQRKSVV